MPPSRQAQSSATPTLSDKTFLTLPGEQWKLLFNDEFDGTQLDTTKWTSGLSWRGDDGSSRHHNSQYASYITDDNVQFSDGNLELLTRKQDVTTPRGKTYNYTQAFIQTDGKFSYTYGYCEVRVKVPTKDGPGLWPAFWMLSHGWPPEDDVAEFWTGRPLPHTHQGFAYRDPNGRVKWDSNHKDSILDGFHTFGMEWGPGYQLFNRDGVITNTSYGSKVPGVPMYLILNSGVASNPAPTARTVFPNAFLVDYVRVYSRPPVPTILNTGFESDTLAPWSTRDEAPKVVKTNAHSGRGRAATVRFAFFFAADGFRTQARHEPIGSPPGPTRAETGKFALASRNSAEPKVMYPPLPVDTNNFQSTSRPARMTVRPSFIARSKPAPEAAFFDDIDVAPIGAKADAH